MIFLPSLKWLQVFSSVTAFSSGIFHYESVVLSCLFLRVSKEDPEWACVLVKHLTWPIISLIYLQNENICGKSCTIEAIQHIEYIISFYVRSKQKTNNIRLCNFVYNIRWNVFNVISVQTSVWVVYQSKIVHHTHNIVYAWYGLCNISALIIL